MVQTTVQTAKQDSVPMRLVAPLWVFWFGLLFGGMILAGFEQLGGTPFLKATHLASSLALVLAGFCFLTGAENRSVKWPLLMIAFGMLFGFFGDLSNAGVLFASGELSLMGGILTFAIGHIFYMTACLAIRERLQLFDNAKWWGSILTWQLISLVGWAAVVLPDTPHTFNHWASLPYCMLLAGTAGMTSGLALQDKRFILFGLGGALFLFSDLVLAVQMFRSDIKIGELLAQTFHWQTPMGMHFFQQVSRNACWLLYGPSQMLIVYASSQIIAAYEGPTTPAKMELPAGKSELSIVDSRISSAEESVT